MKKKGLILLFACVCLLTVGCGKDKDKDDAKESKKESAVRTLTCVKEVDGEKLTMTVKQDKKTFKFTELTMVMETPETSLKDYGITSDQYEEMFCDDEEFTRCSVNVKDGKIIIDAAYDPEDFEEELLEDEDVYEKIDGDTLNTLKEETEKEGATCTLK